MKNFLIGLFILGLTSSAFAQDDIVFKAKLKKEQVPTVVLESVDVDFPGFVVEEFAALPIEYVEEDVYVNDDFDYDDVDTYQISLTGKGKTLIATYNSEGKLLNTVENLKNVAPPAAISKALAQEYPGWVISKDSYHMSHYIHGKEKERYRFTMTKDGKKKHIYTDAEGKMLNRSKRM
ncbi:MAG: hypothetical protein ACOH2D_07275 [Gelidibacter sp.]|uniref:hypothetical protein n=1 Tax=Gelidibacter sp. TaxID=2018083 RepID=UPI003264DDD5